MTFSAKVVFLKLSLIPGPYFDGLEYRIESTTLYFTTTLVVAKFRIVDSNLELNLRIRTRASTTIDRKNKEARAILEYTPADLNDRDERKAKRNEKISNMMSHP